MYDSFTECLKTHSRAECEMVANERLKRSVFVDELSSAEIRAVLKDLEHPEHKPVTRKFIRFLKFAEKPLLVSFPSITER